MNALTWLVVGTISGWVATFILRNDRNSELKINLIAGIVGALAAGIYITPLFEIVTINQKTFSLPSMLVSLGGAIIILIIVNLARWVRVHLG